MVVDTAKKIIESYVNLYIPKKKEKFTSVNKGVPLMSLITAFISWLVAVFAIYLSFRCSKGFNIGQLLLALFCAPCYILYHLAVTKLCGLI
jgi:hypothetical protein